MIYQIAYYSLLGKPVAIYFGMLAFIFMSATALVGYLNFTGRFVIPFKWHPRLAIATLSCAIIHIFLIMSAYYNY
jgi:hypothetical protein